MKTDDEVKQRRITPALRLAIHIRDEFRCWYCELDLSKEEPTNLLLDHLAPDDAEAAAAPVNLLTVCHDCLSARIMSGTSWRAYVMDVDGPVIGAASITTIERQLHRGVNLPLARAILAGRVGEELSDTQEPEE